MATMEIDDKRWYQAWLDTPISFKGASSAAEAMKIPGCAVKSRERESTLGARLPKHHGKLVSYSDIIGARIVVRGHDSPVSPRFVWEGTLAEYYAFWECD